MTVILGVVGVFLVLLFNEWWWRHHKVHEEFSRKFVHIIVGTGAAFAPFFTSWTVVKLLGLVAFLAVVVSRYAGVLKMIHSVQRTTAGEYFFAAAVCLTAFVTTNKYIYAAALLQMGLADGFAAVTGVELGRKHRYSIFHNHHKTLVGTLTFFVISLLILVGYSAAAHAHLAVIHILVVSIVATLIENIAVGGLDNAAVPLFVALALERLV